MSASPWAKIVHPEPMNLQDIMSEEVARDLQTKEDQKYVDQVLNNTSHHQEDLSLPLTHAATTDSIDPLNKTVSSCESDAVIARMLQLQFDKEHDEELKRTESKFNGASKVSISLENYKRAPADHFDDDDDELSNDCDDLDDEKRRDWDRFDLLERELNSIPACGYKKNENGEIVTKHDITMSGRKNACKLLSFPPEFHTGDGELFDLKLSNKVFNGLKIHSKHEQSRRHRLIDKKEDQATAEFGLDEFTRLLIYKLINQELLDHVNGVISIGKEAVILHADCSTTSLNDDNQENQKNIGECVLKVFKTTLSEFKQRDKYIKDDYRFKDRIGKQTARKTVYLWAEKEMHNLYRLKKANIPCPDVVAIKKHVLVMSLIGNDHKPAPKLKDAIMDDADYIIAYEQIVDAMKRMYSDANLVHADLSEYNILWHNNCCYLIDVSQSVEPNHENAFYFLNRDCNNITNFFTKKKVPNVCTSDELFALITGYSYSDLMKRLGMQQPRKIKPHHHLTEYGSSGDDDDAMKMHYYDFNGAWEKSKQQERVVDAPQA